MAHVIEYFPVEQVPGLLFCGDCGDVVAEGKSRQLHTADHRRNEGGPGDASASGVARMVQDVRLSIWDKQ